MKNNIVNLVNLALCVVLVLTSCGKNEFQPPAVGEEVPFQPTSSIPLDEGLKNLSANLFYQAWQKSNLRTHLVEQASVEAQYTFLVLSDRALSAQGWTEAKISNASGLELDNLLSPYVLKSNINLSALQASGAAVIEDSYNSIEGIYFRNDPYFGFATGIKNDNAYYQKAALALDGDGKLVVNGHLSGMREPVETMRGTLWLVDRMIDFKPITTWQFLKADGRFTMYTSIIEYTDSVYHKLFFDHNGYDPLGPKDWGIYWMAEQYDHHTPRQQGMVSYTGEDGFTYIDPLNTWFIPTDEAFHKAGFKSLDDLIRLNEQKGIPDTVHIPDQPLDIFAPVGQHPSLFRQPAFVALKGFFATDSLLDYHGNWGMRLEGYPFWQSRRSVLLFSNDLANVLRVGLPLASLSYETKVGNQNKRTLTTSFDSPLAGISPTKVTVRGLQVDQVNITQSDIFTLNGVIHVVDNLFQPHKTK